MSKKIDYITKFDNRRYIYVSKISKIVYIDVKQIELFNKCPRFFQLYTNKWYLNKKISYQSFNLVHNLQFESLIKTLFSFTTRYHKPIKTNEIVKRYLYKFYKFRNYRTFISDYNNVIDQAIEGTALALKTLKHLENDTRMNYIHLAASSKSNRIGMININRLLDFETDYKFIITINSPYLFLPRYPYDTYNFYYPYVTDKTYNDNDLIYIDPTISIYLKYFIKRTFGYGRRTGINRNYYIKYINPLSNDIYNLKFDLYNVSQTFNNTVRTFVNSVQNDYYNPNQTNDCLKCPAFGYCTSLNMKDKDNLYNKLTEVEINRSDLKKQINNIVEKFDDTTDFVYFYSYLNEPTHF